MFANNTVVLTYEAAHSWKELKIYQKSNTYFLNEQVNQANFKRHLPEGKKVESEWTWIVNNWENLMKMTLVHVDIWLTTYLPYMDNCGHLTDHLPTSSCPRSLWTTPKVVRSKTTKVVILNFPHFIPASGIILRRDHTGINS